VSALPLAPLMNDKHLSDSCNLQLYSQEPSCHGGPWKSTDMQTFLPKNQDRNCRYPCCQIF